MSCLTCKNPDFGMLLIRLGVGSVFLYHGWIKVQNLAGTTGFFDSLGLPAILVYLVIAVELLGGAAMVLGMMTRWAGWLLALDMVGAIFLVKLAQGWIGFEFELLLLLSSLSVVFTGPGKYTVADMQTTNKK